MYLGDQHDLPRFKLNPEVNILSAFSSHALHLQGNIHDALPGYAAVEVERQESVVCLNGSKQFPYVALEHQVRLPTCEPLPVEVSRSFSTFATTSAASVPPTMDPDTAPMRQT